MDYEVQFKRGAQNRVVDALSRRMEDESTLNAITTTEPTCMQEISQIYEHDPVALQLLTELIIEPGGHLFYFFHQGVIGHKGKIYVGKATNLRRKVFEALHQSPLGGHLGQQGTYRRVRMVFY